MIVFGFVAIIYLYLTCRHRGLFILFVPQLGSFERKTCHSKNVCKNFDAGILVFTET